MWLCGLDFGDFLCDALQYLILVFVVVVFLFEAHRVSIVLSLGVEGVDDDLLGALNLGAAERTALKDEKQAIEQKSHGESLHNSLPVPRSRPATKSDMACTEDVRMAQFGCLYHSRHIFYKVGRCFLHLLGEKFDLENARTLRLLNH